MRKAFVCLTAVVGALALAGAASAQAPAPRHACPVVHRYLGAPTYRWAKGISHNAGDETLTTTAYRYGSGPCEAISFQRWSEIMNLVFQHQGHGSFSWRTIKGSWTHIKTVQVPNTCEGGGGPGSSMSTPYGYFALRVDYPNGKLIDTGTAKLRLAC